VGNRPPDGYVASKSLSLADNYREAATDWNAGIPPRYTTQVINVFACLFWSGTTPEVLNFDNPVQAERSTG
jgi:hypothetical protein